MSKQLRLSDVVEINPPRTPNLQPSDEVAFIAMAHVSEDGALIGTEIRKYSDVSSGYTPFAKGDILLAKITPCFENGKSCITSQLQCAAGFGSTEFHVLRPTKEIFPRYLHHLVRSPIFRLRGESRMTGSAGQRRVPADFLRAYEISLPDFGHQKRVAAILDKVGSIREKRGEALKLADELARATFLDRFGALFSNSRDEWVALSDCTDFIDYRGKTPEKSQSGVRLVTAKNVRDGVINIEPAEFISEETYVSRMTRGYPKSGDVLFTTEAPLANVAVLRTTEKVSVGQRLITIRPKEGLRPDFLSWALRQGAVRKDIYSRATGSTVKGIRSAALAHVRLPIPSETDQINFELIVEKLEKQKKEMEDFLLESEALFQSLQQQIFSG